MTAVGINKPRSAPNPLSRSKSTWITTKNNTMKEIEAWAKDGTRTHEMTRSSGQLAENVTEQRVLQAKLWELSKERYKFMSQNTYEKKMFLEQQRKKSDVFQELLKDVIIDVRGRSRNLPGSRAEKQKKDMRRPRSLGPPGKLNHTEQETIPSIDPLFPTEPKVLVRPKTGDNTKFPKIQDQDTFTQSTVRFSMSNKSRSTPGIKGAITSGSIVNKWAKQSPKKREAQGPVADPRYLSLTNALSCTYVIPEDSPDISSLIQSSQALHLKGKKQMETKPKLAMMVRDFMTERGLVF